MSRSIFATRHSRPSNEPDRRPIASLYCEGLNTTKHSVTLPEASLPRGTLTSHHGKWRKGLMTVRILLIDDHPVVRTGLRTVLASELDLEVVGEADNGMRAISLAHRLRPDVVLTDLLLPDI